MCRYNWHSAGSLGWPFPSLKYWSQTKICGSSFCRTALGNCCGLKLADCSLKKNKFIASFIIMFGTLSFSMWVTDCRCCCWLMFRCCFSFIYYLFVINLQRPTISTRATEHVCVVSSRMRNDSDDDDAFARCRHSRLALLTTAISVAHSVCQTQLAALSFLETFVYCGIAARVRSSSAALSITMYTKCLGLSKFVTIQGQLSLASLRGRLIEYQLRLG